VRRKVVVLESCDADNLIRNEIVSVIPQKQFGDSTRFLIKRCAYKALQFIRSLACNI
jgi:hypothetical protein